MIAVEREEGRKDMDNAIEARGLQKTYRGDVKALKGVSLAAAEGTVFGLLGPNGAGKSTMVKILTTLSRPDAGEAYVAGYDVVRQPGKVRLAIGAVAQKSGLDPQMTGRENLVLQGRVYGMRGAALHSRAQELLERFGLEEAGDRTVRTYSGGMQRKLDVAIGLMHRPQVLFLDEPTTGLDPEARVDMWQRDRPARRRRGPHDPDDDALPGGGRRPRPTAGDRRPGRSIVAEGTPDELKGELRGDAIAVELEDAAARRRGPSRRRQGAASSTTSPWSPARCAHGRTAAPAPSRLCSRPSSPRASRSPR